MFKNKLFAIVFGVLLIAFTAYVTLDSFVITRVYAEIPEETETNASQQTGSAADTEDDPEETILDEDKGYIEEHSDAALDSDIADGEPDDSSSAEDSAASDVTETADTSDPVITDTSYSDENISINISEYYENGTAIYVADVQVSSPEYLKTALAYDSYGRNVTAKTSEISEDNNAILAINGDYYGSQEKGYVLRNGILYRNVADSDQEDLVIYKDGSFQIINESSVSAEELEEADAEQVLSFGPALITDGSISINENEEVGRSMASNPRTAIGIIDELHYVFVVSDGRTDESEGLSLYELAQFMQNLGVETAYNLDGGGSSTMYFNGNVVNNPTSGGGGHRSSGSSERSVSDIIYIGY